MVQEGKLERRGEGSEGECMSKRKKESSSFWGARLQSSRVWDAPVFKMPAESHLIYPKPTWRGTAVNVSVCVGKTVKKERSTERQTDRAHCTTAYLRHKLFWMLCWGLCSINGSAYRFKLQIGSAKSSPLSLRLTQQQWEICREQIGGRILLALSCT